MIWAREAFMKDMVGFTYNVETTRLEPLYIPPYGRAHETLSRCVVFFRSTSGGSYGSISWVDTARTLK